MVDARGRRKNAFSQWGQMRIRTPSPKELEKSMRGKHALTWWIVLSARTRNFRYDDLFFRVTREGRALLVLNPRKRRETCSCSSKANKILTELTCRVKKKDDNIDFVAQINFCICVEL